MEQNSQSRRQQRASQKKQSDETTAPVQKTFLQKVKSFLFGKKEKKKPETFIEQVVSLFRTAITALFVVMIVNGIAVATFVVPTGSMENTVMTGDFLLVNKFKYGPSTPQVIPFFNIPLPYYKTPPIIDPKQGDVIVFIYPGDRNEVKPKEFLYYLKRCVAVSGDVLQIVNKKILVNGVEFALPPNAKFDPFISTMPYDTLRTFPIGKGYSKDNYGPIRVPKTGDIINLSIQNIQEWQVFIGREGHKVETQGTQVLIDGKPAVSYAVERDYVFGIGDNRDNSEDSRFWGFVPKQDVVGTPMMVYWSWNTDANDFGSKLKSIRWSRLFNFIN
jgi:signal peptidase I